jgi:hypothetical protein
MSGYRGLLCGECENPNTHYFDWIIRKCNECSAATMIWEAILIIPISLILPIFIYYFLSFTYQRIPHPDSDRIEVKTENKGGSDDEEQTQDLHEIYNKPGDMINYIEEFESQSKFLEAMSLLKIFISFAQVRL